MAKYSHKKSLSKEPTLTVTEASDLPSNADAGTIAWVTSLERFYLKKPENVGWLPIIETSQYAGPAEYTVLRSPLDGVVNESGTLTVSLSTVNVPDGTTVDYTWSGTGLTQDDIKDGAITGSMVITNSQSTVNIELDEDSVTEGEETVTFTLAATDNSGNATGSPSTSFTIQDSSLSPDVVFQNWDISYVTSAWDLEPSRFSAAVGSTGIIDGMTFSNDGNKLITLIANSDGVVNVYNLDAPYQVPSLGVPNKTNNFQVTSTRDIQFNNDGTIMYLLTTTGIRTYTLSIAYDVTTATQTANTGFGTGSNDYNAMHIDRTHLFLLDNEVSPEQIVITQFELSTAWNVTTASFVRGTIGTYFGIRANQTGRSMTMSADGKTLWFSVTNGIGQIECRSPFNLSTSSLADTRGLDTPSLNVHSFAVNPEGEYLLTNFSNSDGNNFWFPTSTAYSGNTLLRFTDDNVQNDAPGNNPVDFVGSGAVDLDPLAGQISSVYGYTGFTVEATDKIVLGENAVPAAELLLNGFEISFWLKYNGNLQYDAIAGRTILLLPPFATFSIGNRVDIDTHSMSSLDPSTTFQTDNKWHHYSFKFTRRKLTADQPLYIFRDGQLINTGVRNNALAFYAVNPIQFLTGDHSGSWAVDDVFVDYNPDPASVTGDSFTPPLRSSGVTDIDLGKNNPAEFGISVTAPSSSNYLMSGTHRGDNNIVNSNDPDITIMEGDTIVFYVSASGHPFYIKTQAGTGTGNTVPGVTNNGESNGTISWTPDTAGTYYYQCSIHSSMVGTITVQAGPAVGSQTFSTPGTYQWTAPEGVTSVSVVCVGGGGGGGSRGDHLSNGSAGQGGYGGSLGWKNDITVIPGQAYTVEVGAGGTASLDITTVDGNDGGDSYFINTSTVYAKGGVGGLSGGSTGVENYQAGAFTNAFVGDGGGAGGAGGRGSSTNNINPSGGGGGAGGYSGAGGAGGDATDAYQGLGNPRDAGNAGSGGAGGGGSSGVFVSGGVRIGSGGGGGVGLLSVGPSGSPTAIPTDSIIVYGGNGGSGGEDVDDTTPGSGYTRGTAGGLYGGGGGGHALGQSANPGGNGAVRIIWGPGRSFPNNAS